MRGKEGEGQLSLGGEVKREGEVVVRGMEGRVSGGNEDIRTQKIKDLLSFGILVVVRVLFLLSLSEFSREPFWGGEINVRRGW
jgi:hypothetical protein